MLKPTRPMRRRRFVTLVAMGSAALLTSPLSNALAALEKRRNGKPERRPLPSPAIRKEIGNQEKSLADQLKVIRGYELPPGSPMAFAFEPRVSARKRGQS